jgi:hypothetical protein
VSSKDNKRPGRRIACVVSAVAYEGDDCWLELSSDELPQNPKLLVVLNPPIAPKDKIGFQFLEGLRKFDHAVEIDPDFPATTVYLDAATGLIYVDAREDAWGKIERFRKQDCVRLLGKAACESLK